MTEFFDADGKPVEAVSTDAFRKLEEDKQVLEGKLEEQVEQLQKLENKDHNFSQVRNMVNELEQKNKDLEEKMNQEQERIKIEQEQKAKTAIEEIQVELLQELVGEDQEEMKKVMFHYDRLADEATTKEQIEKKMKDAVKLSSAEKEASPLNRVLGLTGEAPKKKESSYSESEDGQQLAKEIGLNYTKEEKK